MIPAFQPAPGANLMANWIVAIWRNPSGFPRWSYYELPTLFGLAQKSQPGADSDNPWYAHFGMDYAPVRIETGQCTVARGCINCRTIQFLPGMNGFPLVATCPVCADAPLDTTKLFTLHDSLRWEYQEVFQIWPAWLRKEVEEVFHQIAARRAQRAGHSAQLAHHPIP